MKRQSTPETHRLKEARIRSGVSQRAVARRTGLSLAEVARQEESDNISLSDLQKWKDALGVPIAELLTDSPERTDELIRLRAGMIQVMRSLASLDSSDVSDSQKAIIQNMRHELEGLMPELSSVKSWPQFGGRRQRREPARIESQIIATSIWCPEVGNEV